MATSTANNATWSSRLGFILASASSAIGLGAIWKFPFWAGTNGGAAFIVPFLIFTFTIGVVLVMAEVAMGRAGRGSAVYALKQVGGPFFWHCWWPCRLKCVHHFDVLLCHRRLVRCLSHGLLCRRRCQWRCQTTASTL